MCFEIGLRTDTTVWYYCKCTVSVLVCYSFLNLCKNGEKGLEYVLLLAINKRRVFRDKLKLDDVRLPITKIPCHGNMSLFLLVYKQQCRYVHTYERVAYYRD